MKKKSSAQLPYSPVNRRDFLAGGSLATLLMMMGGVELKAQDGAKPPLTPEKKSGPPVGVGVIGLGTWGRDILSTLSRLPNAPVVGMCDHYPASLKKAAEIAPKAVRLEKYQELIDSKEVQAVVIATPTHQHKEIALAALKAGKHVYCEVPLAHTIEDAKAIALAAKEAKNQIFQSGLTYRANPQHHHVFTFFRSGASGRTVFARAQSHKKQSWRKASPNPEREKELNWRLDPSLSLGLVGELGILQVDVANWYLKALPSAVNGMGGVMFYEDGREVADTIQAVFEYPKGMRLSYDATLANSFDGSYEMYYGSDAAIMIRGSRAWMFKEVDSPLLGWEVYARKEEFFGETGIALVANATKLLAQGKKPAEGASDSDSPLFYSLEEFLENINEKKAPSAGYLEGFQSAVAVIKANEAVRKNQRIEIAQELYKLG